MQVTKFIDNLKTMRDGLLNSYSQVFFSNNKIFASIILLVSFFDFGAGLSGVIAILIGQFTAFLFSFNKDLIKDGTYTYNSVLVGVAIGIFYDFNLSFFILLTLSSIMVFFLTIWFLTTLGKKGLPFLSIPFLLAVWIIILGANNFTTLELKEKETLTLAIYFPELFTNTTEFIGRFPFANAAYLYFRSLGAIFFQYNDLAGIFLAIGILIYSRIGFVLSLFGFAVGYLFYHFLGGDFSQLIYSYIGFNFILTAIALGGFFVVPSRRSFLLLLFTIPTIGLLISSMHTLLGYFNLPLYSLPFNIVVLLFLAAMAIRTKSKGLQLVTLQQFSPEKNHYKYYNSVERFSSESYFHISLPIIGEWNISQGHDGEITHQDEWKHAWDFDIRDDENKSFKDPGYNLNDYFAYDSPVAAPSSGYIVQIIDGVNDNEIGKVDLENNWGNTIVIKHGEYIFSKLSHLKKDTIKVKVGDYIKKNEVIAYSGSSGRSPEPHLHFQVQSTQYIGSKTLQYPVSYYLTKEEDKYKFHSFEIPKAGETVSNVQNTKLLIEAFSFIPGKTLKFKVKNNGIETLVEWEVFVTSLNQTYIYCHNTKSTAYFVNNGTLFYFTDFYGNKNSLLHLFYLGAHKILLGYYDGVEINDKLLIDSFFNPIIKNIHDLTAPLFHYCKANYNFKFTNRNEEHNPSVIELDTICTGRLFSKKTKQQSTHIVLENNSISKISISLNNNKIEATCID